MPRTRVAFLVVLSAALNTAGWVLRIAEDVALYDEVAHLLTPLVLVAITSEIIYRAGGDDLFFSTRVRALLTGAGIGLVGALGWELIELILDSALGVSVYHPPWDTVSDVVLGVVGGSIGAWRTDRHLDRTARRPGK